MKGPKLFAPRSEISFALPSTPRHAAWKLERASSPFRLPEPQHPRPLPAERASPGRHVGDRRPQGRRLEQSPILARQKEILVMKAYVFALPFALALAAVGTACSSDDDDDTELNQGGSAGSTQGSAGTGTTQGAGGAGGAGGGTSGTGGAG